MATRNEEGREARDDALFRFVLGEMAESESQAFRRRLADEPELAAEARELERTLGLMAYAPAADPPAGLRDRVLAAATAPRGKVVRPSRWRRRAALAALAASVLVAIGVGLDDLRLRRELALLREANDTLLQPNVVVSFALRGTGESADAYGHAVLDLDAKKAALVVEGLPPLPGDRAYALWALVGDEHVPCGSFGASADERIVRQFAIPVKDYTEPVRRLIVTVEADADADEPAGPTIMRST